MNGAESLARTLVAGDVTVCFANPGTSEMQMVAALDRVDGIRGVLCLFEGVATGAADGYARMAEKPAATLLHLGPGLANGLANLHNLQRARSPVVNLIGDHATYHRQYDSPLTADIEALARPYSDWLKTCQDAKTVGQDAADAITLARTAPGRIANLILPADTAWNEGGVVGTVAAPEPAPKVDDEPVREAAEALRSGEPALILLGDRALMADGLALAAGIARQSGARMLAETSNKRIQRGAGRVAIERLPYPVDQALAALRDVRHLILVGAREPVAFFAYPGKPSLLAPPECRVHHLAAVTDDQVDALARLADMLGAGAVREGSRRKSGVTVPAGPIDAAVIPTIIADGLPDQAIVCDESITTGRGFFAETHAAAPHDWLQLSGGAIGLGIPMAIGAAVACPDRKVISLQADGSAMYTVQGLWTQARERLDVLTVIWSNRSYAILNHELANVGARNPGPKALGMLSLGNPDIGWVDLARSLGVDACRVEDAAAFQEAFRRGVMTKGPSLIEVML